MRRLLSMVMICGAMALPAAALTPGEILPNAQLEARARALSAQFRCLVCQNQSIDDSDAALAKDLRVIVRERLVAGDSDQQVKAYLVARYGDFVLLKPPLNFATLLLWGTPALAVVFGALAMVLATRRRTDEPVSPPLSAQEEAALANLVNPQG